MLKKQLLAIVVALIVVTSSAYCVVFAASQICRLGIEYRQLKAERTIVAIVGPHRISRLDVEHYQVSRRLLQNLPIPLLNKAETANQLTDDEVVRKLVESKVLYLEAEKAGLVIPDQILDDKLADVKTYLESDQTAIGHTLRDSLTSLDLTADKFLAICRPIFREQLSIDQLRSKTIVELTDLEEIDRKWLEAKAEMIQLYQSEITIMP